MVRLRREIEGIRYDRTAALPPWCDDDAACSALAPGFDDAVCAHDALRILIAGLPRLDLATRLARLGRFVTVCDVAPERLAQVHASLPPDVAARLQLVDKNYGSAAFSPSSFDLVVFGEAWSCYDEPMWVAHKLARELKVDGVLMARLWLRGAHAPLDEAVVVEASDDIDRSIAARLADAGARALVRSSTQLADGGALATRVFTAGLDIAGADAIDRGAWHAGWSPRHDATTQLSAIDSRLRIERVAYIDVRRPVLAALAAHGKAPLRAAALHLLQRLPERVEAALRSPDDGRIVTLIARRALGDRRLMAGRTR